MTAEELRRLVEKAIEAGGEWLDRFERLKDVAFLLGEDVGLVRHSHDTFLPAARDYLRGKSDGDQRLRAARVRRARLGGASRWLYDHQRRTFERAVKLLCPLPVPPVVVSGLWERIKRAEIRALRDARRRHGT
jgi:hypothetical protein